MIQGEIISLSESHGTVERFVLVTGRCLNMSFQKTYLRKLQQMASRAGSGGLAITGEASEDRYCVSGTCMPMAVAGDW